MDTKKKRRVVITGLGTVNPTGNTVAESWANIKAGRCAVGPITAFDTADFKVKLAAEVKDFDPAARIDKREARKMARFTQFAVSNKYGGKLDGAQGVPEDMLLKAGTFGVCKINIDTDLRLAMTASIRKHLATNPADFDPRQYLKPAREAIKQMVAHKMRDVLNSSNRL